jgi:hypothetical protein
MTKQFHLCQWGQLSWKTAPLFRNNVWIVGCTWLSNLSMYVYSLAVIWPSRAIMGTVPWYCSPNHYRTSSMFHCWI